MAGPGFLLSRVLSYNVMSLRQAGRVNDLAKVLRRKGCLCLQGTREPAGDQPVAYRGGLGFHQFSSGYSKVSNKHAGVAIFVSDRVPLECVSSVAWPTELPLRGRALALRIKTTQSVIVFVSAYVPPYCWAAP